MKSQADGKGARLMSRLNGIFTLAIIIINILVLLFSLGLASFGIYIETGNWGSSPSAFLSNVRIDQIIPLLS
jgi:membrane associated rhomboid family serine protease